MNTIKQIQKKWDTFHKNPSKNPVSDKDLIRWVNHIDKTADMLKEYPKCHSTYFYLTQQSYSLGLVLNIRGFYRNNDTRKWEFARTFFPQPV